MLVEFKDTRLLILPKVKSDIPRKAGFYKTRRLLPGMNEIDNEYWVEAKKHHSVKQKLENGVIIEHVMDVKDKAKKVAEVEKATKEVEEIKNDIKEKKKASRKTRNKEEKEKLNKEVDDLEESLLDAEEEADEKEAKLYDEISDFTKFSHKEKEKIIKDTLDIETLRAWKAKDDFADCRNLIEDQISAIKNAKIDPKIGKPSNSI